MILVIWYQHRGEGWLSLAFAIRNLKLKGKLASINQRGICFISIMWPMKWVTSLMHHTHLMAPRKIVLAIIAKLALPMNQAVALPLWDTLAFVAHKTYKTVPMPIFMHPLSP